MAVNYRCKWFYSITSRNQDFEGQLANLFCNQGHSRELSFLATMKLSSLRRLKTEYSFCRKIDVHYLIFDEAHVLKNMTTSRYENLMRVEV